MISPPFSPRVPRLGSLVFSRVVRDRLVATRRDLRTFVDGLQGRHPPPLVEVGLRAAPGTVAMVADGARELRVVEVKRETADAVSVWLEDPAGQPIDFVPGQFLTALVSVDGGILRRAYSLASSASRPERVRLGIKRVEDGRVSNRLNDALRVGDSLRVLGPSGNFRCAPDPARARHVVLWGGGSGITPLLSIALGVLEAEPESRVSLVYGNRRLEDVIFAEELAGLCERYPGRFVLRQVLSEPPAQWSGGVGILDCETAERELATLGSSELPAEYYLCGPVPMMDACRGVLLAAGVSEAQIQSESFFAPGLARANSLRQVVSPQPLRVELGGVARDFRTGADQTLLEAGLSAGLPMPYSCAMGGCGACKVKLRDGQVDVDEPNCLSDQERAAGYVLACVSRAVSPCHIEVEP